METTDMSVPPDEKHAYNVERPSKDTKYEGPKNESTPLREYRIRYTVEHSVTIKARNETDAMNEFQSTLRNNRNVPQILEIKEKGD